MEGRRAGLRLERCTRCPSLEKPGGKLNPQLQQSQCQLPASPAGTPDCSRVSHSQSLTFPAPIS